MSGLLTTLLIGGLIIGGAVVLINPDNRCNYLGLCGQTAAAEPVLETTTGTIEAPVAEDTSSGDSGPGDGTRKSRGCCVCEMQGDRVKCQKSGTGVWFNPPAGSGGSNDKDLDLSLDECNKGGCSGNTSTGSGIKATGSVKAGAGAGGNKSSSGGGSSGGGGGGGSKSTGGAGSGSGVKTGASVKRGSTSSRPRSSGAGSGAGVRTGVSLYTMSNDGHYYQMPQSYYTGIYEDTVMRMVYPEFPRIRGKRVYLPL